MSESLVEEMASVEEFKRVRWADLEEDEQSLRCEQAAEREGIKNRSEAAEAPTETQAAAERQEKRGEEKERQTENVCPDVNVTLDSERRNVGSRAARDR